MKPTSPPPPAAQRSAVKVSLMIIASGLTGAALADTPAPAPAAAQSSEFDKSIEDALNLGGGKYGKINFDIRTRYEYVDQDAKATPDPANAWTTRFRIGYLTPEFFGFKAFVEYEGNQPFINDYNDGVPNKLGNQRINFPVVADPYANELNQGWLSYSGIPGTVIKAGRQRLIFDNHRFIGNVIWRQLEQTYDAVTITNSSLPRTNIVAGYIFGVQNIYSGQVDLSSPVLHAEFDTGYGKLIGYGLWLDFRRKTDSNNYGNSNQTYGIRFDGATPITDGLKGLYTAEYAYQSDYASSPLHYQASYYLVEGGLDIYGLTLKGAMEELGGENGVGFQTPLATLHAFQGWADQFLRTPGSGIRDLYGTAKYSLFGIDLMAVYHDFTAPNSGVSFGNEIDLQAEKKFGKHYSILVKWADYTASGFAQDKLKKVDTEKFWVQASVSF